MSEEEIRSKSQCCSVIILGGIGFSGLNENSMPQIFDMGKVLMNYQEKQL